MGRELVFRCWKADEKKMITLNLYQAEHYEDDFILRDPETAEEQSWVDDHIGEL